MRVIREQARESILPPSVLIETTGIVVQFFWKETLKGNKSRIIIFHLKTKFKTLVTGLSERSGTAQGINAWPGLWQRICDRGEVLTEAERW